MYTFDAVSSAAWPEIAGVLCFLAHVMVLVFVVAAAAIYAWVVAPGNHDAPYILAAIAAIFYVVFYLTVLLVLWSVPPRMESGSDFWFWMYMMRPSTVHHCPNGGATSAVPRDCPHCDEKKAVVAVAIACALVYFVAAGLVSYKLYGTLSAVRRSGRVRPIHEE